MLLKRERVWKNAVLFATVFLVAIMLLYANVLIDNNNKVITRDGVTKDLVGYWNFNEGSGTKVNDSSGNGFTGFANNTTWVSGIGGHALKFGSTSSVSIPDVANFLSTHNSSSIAHVAWIKTTTTSDAQITGEKQTHIHSELQIESGGIVHFWMENSADADFYVKSTTKVNDGAWHFIVGQYNYTTKIMEIWVDGKLEQRATKNFEPMKTVNNFYIGYGDTGHYSGIIDEVRIYNRTLTEGEIKELYYMHHNPIRINGDSDFTPDNGVIDGNGTKGNPYIILALDIDAHGDGASIYIGNTTKYFVVEHCKLYDTAYSSFPYDAGAGVILYNVSNGVIRDNEVYQTQYGILVENSANISILGNSVYNNEHEGIYLRGSNNAEIAYNTVNDSGYYEILIYSSNHNHVDNNTVYNATQYGVAIWSSSMYNIIENNRIYNNSGIGIVIYSSDSNIIAYNDIENNTHEGIEIISNSDNNSVYGNFLLYNHGSNDTFNSSHIQAYDDGNNNSWNNSLYGNYWLDWAENNNTNDNNHDTIVDWPYKINGSAGAKDYLPLKNKSIVSFPSAPQNIQAHAGVGYVNLTWDAPSDDGGSPILGYIVYRNGENISYVHGNRLWYNDSSVNDDVYVYQVSAKNARGEGNKSNNAVATPVSWTYTDDFSTNSGKWIYYGNASYDSNRKYMLLTNGDQYQKGKVIFKNTIWAEHFIVSFRFDSYGPDGMTVMFYKDTHYALVGGGALGFGKNASGYGVEMDAYKNSWDPSSKHIAIIQNTTKNHLVYENDRRAADLGWHRMIVDVHSTDIEVYVDNDMVLKYTGPIDRSFGGFGFSAATGYLSGLHRIDDVKIYSPLAPYSPKNVTAKSGVGFVNLTWKAPDENGTSNVNNYKIYRNGSLIATVPVSQTWYNDTSVSGGINYTYYVTAVSSAGESDRSNEVNATPISEPRAPQNLHANAGNGYVNLSWTAPANDGGATIIEYRIYRNGTLIATVPASQLWYNDTNVSNEITYKYYVTAVNSVGEGEKSNEVQATPSATVPELSGMEAMAMLLAITMLIILRRRNT